MLRWPGDFCVSRLRGQLAVQYCLDPNVAPDYEEVYRPELGGRVITRRVGPSLGSSAATLHGLSATGSHSATSLGLGRSFGGGDFSDSKSRLTRASSSTSLASQLPQLARDSSAPQLGLRRVRATPASLDQSQRLGGSPAPSPSFASLAAAAGGGKEAEQALKERLASKELWTQMSGTENVIQKFIAERKEELVAAGGGTGYAKLAPLLAKYVPGSLGKHFKNGASLEWRNEEWDGATLLIKAIRTGQLELATWCLARGANGLVVDDSGRGVLHWAAFEGLPEMVDLLLTAIPDLPVCEADNGGDTPLHIASYHGHLAAVRLLIKVQDDVKAALALANNGGFTPLDLAHTRRMWHVVRYLMEPRMHEDDRQTEEKDPAKTDEREWWTRVPVGVRRLHRATDLVRRQQLEDLRADPFSEKAYSCASARTALRSIYHCGL
eukprot:TRINITY_DN5432_c0_g1_i1.p1 TRINITY_DN5432_c0_g1~~TRINITY_DN5432_c0_g1_i1.p1  ORF type:complete len:438 (-),score=98.49 TRINITY_DN5432_c0_g1_i1:264-1577(-)